MNDSHIPNRRQWSLILAVILLAGVQLACALTSSNSPPDVEALAGEQSAKPEDQSEISGEEGGGSSSEAGGGRAPVEAQSADDLSLPCPQAGATLYLGFDHALTVNYNETSLTHFVHQGWLELVVNEGGQITSARPTTLTTSLEGKMSPECSLSGGGSMIPNAHGACQDGVVSLVIEENWEAMQAQMTCVDEDGETTVAPFEIPAVGTLVNSGVDGNGVNFLLVEGEEGYSTMRPFQHGSGYHTWTLYTVTIPNVPLTTPEE